MTLLSVTEAADREDMSPRHVRRLVADGLVVGRRVGHLWGVDAASLRAYLDYGRARRAGATSLLSVMEAAERYGLSTTHIRRLVSSGRVRGRLFGNSWAINDRSLRSYLAKERRRGPKPRRRHAA